MDFRVFQKSKIIDITHYCKSKISVLHEAHTSFVTFVVYYILSLSPLNHI